MPYLKGLSKNREFSNESFTTWSADQFDAFGKAMVRGGSGRFQARLPFFHRVSYRNQLNRVHQEAGLVSMFILT